MPHFTPVHHHSKHRNHKPHTAPRNGLQHPNIPSTKLGPIQRHLPALPASHARLLTNVRHHTRKFAHLATAFINASISRLLPTQNGVR
jgi:hypothetical protein